MPTLLFCRFVDTSGCRNIDTPPRASPTLEMQRRSLRGAGVREPAKLTETLQVSSSPRRDVKPFDWGDILVNDLSMWLMAHPPLCRCVAVSLCRCVAVSLCRCVAVSIRPAVEV